MGCQRCQVFLLKILYYLSEVFFTFTNSVNPDEMQHYLGLFANVLVKGFPEYKGLTPKSVLRSAFS